MQIQLQSGLGCGLSRERKSFVAGGCVVLIKKKGTTGTNIVPNVSVFSSQPILCRKIALPIFQTNTFPTDSDEDALN